MSQNEDLALSFSYQFFEGVFLASRMHFPFSRVESTDEAAGLQAARDIESLFEPYETEGKIA